MIRDAIIVALRSSSKPMGSGDLVRHMPWQRGERPAYGCDRQPCDTPRDGPGDPCIVKVLSCTGKTHIVDRRPPSRELNAHLRALCKQGLVQLAEGTEPGRRHLWQLTAAGAARSDIETVRGIVNLDETPTPPRAAPRSPLPPLAANPGPKPRVGEERIMAEAQLAASPKCSCQAQIDRLTADNERLRRTIQCLISAQALINDAVGVWTMPTIPNN